MLDIAAAINYSEEKTNASVIPRFYAEDAMKDFQLADKNWDNLIEKAKNQPSLRKKKQASMQRGLMEANHRKHREMAKSSLNAKKPKMPQNELQHTPSELRGPRFTTADYVVPPGMAIPRKPASMEQKIAIAPKKAEDILWSPNKWEHSQDYYTSVSVSITACGMILADSYINVLRYESVKGKLIHIFAANSTEYGRQF
jgi:hypothetical protein